MPKIPPATLPTAPSTVVTASPPVPGARSTASLHRQVFLQPALADQELLAALEHLR